MRNTLLIAFMGFIIIIGSVTALQYRDVCNDNQTLNKFMNFTACENVTCIDYNFSQLVQCQFGCDNSTNACRQAPIQEYGIYFIGIIAILISLGVVKFLWRR